MSNNKPEFYAARDAVENGLLHKCSLGTLKKHIAALQEHYPWKDDPLCADAAMKTYAELKVVEKEYERRKAVILKGVAKFIGAILASVIAGLILFFVTGYLRSK